MVDKARRGTTTVGQKARKASEANGSSSESERSSSTATAACGLVNEPAAAAGVGKAHSMACAGQAEPKTEDVEISKIVIPEGHRDLDERRVDSLVGSIEKMGLLQPIGLRSDHRLLYGRHRLAAYKKLGRTSISAQIIEFNSPLLEELAGLDENLERQTLSAAEEAQALARRKAIFEQLYPETQSVAKRGGPGRGNKTNDKLSPVSFAADTAAKTGQSRRTIERKVKTGQDLDPQAAKMLKGTTAEDNQLELEALSRLPAEKQQKVAAQIKAGEVKSVRKAEPPDVPNDEGTAEEALRLLERLVAALKDCGIYQDFEDTLQEIKEALKNCSNDDETGEWRA
jgi:ParB family chromosome partitioning protein